MYEWQKRLIIYDSYDSSIIISADFIDTLLIYSDFSDNKVYAKILKKGSGSFFIDSMDGTKRGFIFMVGV